MQDIT